MQWEYKIASYKSKTTGFISSTLNTLGLQNWELVNCQAIKVAGGGSHMQAVFKRPR